MTLEKLNSYADLARQLKAAESLLERLKCSVVPGAQVLTGMPHTSGYADKLGELVPEIVDVQNTIVRLKEQIAMREAEIVQFLYSIPDLHTRTIFRLRFLRGWTWAHVANAVGGKNTADSVRMICTRYFA